MNHTAKHQTLNKLLLHLKNTVFWDVTLCNVGEFVNILEGHTTSIIMVKVYAKQAERRVNFTLPATCFLKPLSDPEDRGGISL
jgi:hypothetical protein